MTQTHFGYQNVPEEDKVHKVAQVFHSVAARYDVMNDLMSAGLHRIWKAFTVAQAAALKGADLPALLAALQAPAQRGGQ